MKRKRKKPKQQHKTNNNTTIKNIYSEIKEDLKVYNYIKTIKIAIGIRKELEWK